MPSPFIDALPQSSTANSQASRSRHAGREPTTSFSAVLERSTPPQPERSRPSRGTPDAGTQREREPAAPAQQRERTAEGAPEPQRASETRGGEEAEEKVANPAQGDEADESALPASLAAIASVIAALHNRPATAEGEGEGDLLFEGQARKGLLAQLADAGRRGPPPDQALDAESGEQTTLLKAVKADPTVALVAQGTQTGRFAEALARSTTSQQEVPFSGITAPGTTTALRADATNTPQLLVPTPAGQRMWSEDVGSKLLWMVGRNESKAELVLTPPNLGKLGVSIQVNGDQTTAHFVASSQAARDALEQAMPRLREILQQAGVNLGETNVSTSSEQQARGEQEPKARGGRHFNGDDDVATAPLSVTAQGAMRLSGTGAIDTFA